MIEVNELDAIYFMVSMVFDKEPQEVVCTHCGASHLDKDWFSVHPHRSHLCAACGRHFRDDKTAVGNPASRVRALVGSNSRVEPPKERITLCQADYPGGIRIWGSNQAILWTSHKPERSGIHVHAYMEHSERAAVDDTFGRVVVDGVSLDQEAVRTYMAQMALPHLAPRVVAASCVDCGTPAFDKGDDAFTPAIGRACRNCGGGLKARGRYRSIVANPLIDALNTIAQYAVRSPQKHDLGLLPETL